MTPTTKDAIPNPDTVVVRVSCYRLNFLRPYYEEEGGRIGRVRHGKYYGPLVLFIPVLPVRGPNMTATTYKDSKES